MSIDISRLSGGIVLPEEVSNEVLSKTQDASGVMAAATQVSLPGNGVTVPLLATDAQAQWVDETEEKAVSRPEYGSRKIGSYTLAVIVPFSNQFKRDAANLYNEAIRRLPGELARKFDETVLTAAEGPGEHFHTFAGVDAVSLAADAYAGLVEADADIADSGHLVNGWMLAPQARRTLLTATDGNSRPLFVNSAAEGSVPMLLGSRTFTTKGAYKAAADEGEAQIGIAGDWSQAFWGTVEGVQMSISDQATLNDGEKTINLWQRNMFAVRAEIEVGFAYGDAGAFRRLTV